MASDDWFMVNCNTDSWQQLIHDHFPPPNPTPVSNPLVDAIRKEFGTPVTAEDIIAEINEWQGEEPKSE